MSEERLNIKRQRVSADLLSTDYIPIANCDSIHSEKIKHLQELYEDMEYKNKLLQSQLQDLQSSFNTTIENKDQLIKNLNIENADFKAKAVFHKRRRDEAIKKVETTKEMSIGFKNKYDEKIAELEMKLEEAEDELDEQRQKEKSLEFQLSLKEAVHEENERLQNEKSVLSELIEKNNDTIAALQKKDIENEKIIGELKSQVSQLEQYQKERELYEEQTKQNKYLLECSEKSKIIQEELTNRLAQYVDSSKDFELLRLEKDSLQSKVNDLSKVREEKFELQLENAKLKEERTAWAPYLQNAYEYNTEQPYSIIHNLKMEAEKAKQMDSLKSLYESQLENYSKIITGLESHIEELKQTTIKYEQRLSADEASKTVLTETADMLRERIGRLESHLDFYNDLNKDDDDAVQTRRIYELEKMLDERENEIVSKNEEISGLLSMNTPVIHISNGPYDKLTSGSSLTNFITELKNKEQSHLEELHKAISEKTDFEKRYDAANQEIESLRKLLPSDTKMSEYQETIPSQESEEQEQTWESEKSPEVKFRTKEALRLRRLEKENADLNELLKNNNISVDVVSIPKSALEGFEAEKKELEAEIEAKEKRINRVVSLCQERIETLMESFEKLFGFKCSRRDEETFCLESIYSKPLEIYFLVKTKKKRPTILRVMGNKRDEYLDQWSDLYQNHIILDNDVPAFLIAVQSEMRVTYHEMNDLEDVQMDMEG